VIADTVIPPLMPKPVCAKENIGKNASKKMEYFFMVNEFKYAYKYNY